MYTPPNNTGIYDRNGREIMVGDKVRSDCYYNFQKKKTQFGEYCKTREHIFEVIKNIGKWDRPIEEIPKAYFYTCVGYYHWALSYPEHLEVLNELS